MGCAVTSLAMCQCTFGLAPSTFQATPSTVSIKFSSFPMATIQDYKPNVNILPFGMCQSMANPQVAAATSAAMGVLTPMPCLPNTVTPWTPGSPTVMVGGSPALNQLCTLNCLWGGVISIKNPGPNTATVQLP